MIVMPIGLLNCELMYVNCWLENGAHMNGLSMNWLVSKIGLLVTLFFTVSELTWVRYV